MKSRLARTLQLGGAAGVTLALISTEARSWTSVSCKFMSELPGERSKSGSKAGSRKSRKPRGSRIIIIGLPWLSRLRFVPKLELAGSTPVARSNAWLEPWGTGFRSQASWKSERAWNPPSFACDRENTTADRRCQNRDFLYLRSGHFVGAVLEHGEVGELAGLDASRQVIDAEHVGGVDCDHPERLLDGHPLFGAKRWKLLEAARWRLRRARLDFSSIIPSMLFLYFEHPTLKM